MEQDGQHHRWQCFSSFEKMGAHRMSLAPEQMSGSGVWLRGVSGAAIRTPNLAVNRRLRPPFRNGGSNSLSTTECRQISSFAAGIAVRRA